MSWLSNAAKAVKKGVVDTGHFIGNAQNNKWVKGAEAAGLALTGVGIPMSAALMGGAGALGGALRSGGGLKGAITQGGQGILQGAAAGIGGKVLGKIPQIQSLRHALGGGDGGGGAPTQEEIDNANGPSADYHDPNQSSFGEANDWLKGHVPGVSGIEGFVNNHGGLTGMLGGLAHEGLDFATGNGGLNALGVAQGINAASLQKKADDYAKDAVGGVQASYNQRAPLRVAGVQGMLNPQTNDISSLTANSGVYGRGLPKIAPAKSYAA